MLDSLDYQALLPKFTTIMVIAIVLLIINLGVRRISNFLKTTHQRQQKTRLKIAMWQYLLFESSHLPLAVFSWTYLVIMVIKTIAPKLHLQHLPYDGAITVTIIGLIFWWLIKFVHLYESSLFAASKNRTNVVQGAKIAQIVIVVVFVLILTENLGISISSILAFGGAGALVAGFAAKDVLSNVFAAINIFTDKPFVVGDYIAFPEKNLDGVVEYIGWRHIKIRQLTNSLLILPNAMIGNTVIENISATNLRRFNEELLIEHASIAQAAAIIKDIQDYVHSSDLFDQRLPLSIGIFKVTAIGVVIKVQATLTIKDWDRYLNYKTQIYTAIGNIITAKKGKFSNLKLINT